MNNKIGGDFINISNNQLYSFWKIGKFAYERQNYYDNVIEKLSIYCSYHFGDSLLYTRENIHLMKRFYLNFPIFCKKLNILSWEQYQLFLMIPNRKERHFYFYLSLLFHSDYQETFEFISNDYYARI